MIAALGTLLPYRALSLTKSIPSNLFLDLFCTGLNLFIVNGPLL
jgi:hypothetical protein